MSGYLENSYVGQVEVKAVNGEVDFSDIGQVEK